MLAQQVLFAIEGDEWGTLGLGTHYDAVTLDHIGVKAVERLTVGHHHVVGDIDNVVDRTQTDGAELVLEPLGAFLDLAAGDTHTGIALAGFGIINLYLDGQRLVVYLEVIAAGAVERCLVAVAAQPGIEVARHTIV